MSAYLRLRWEAESDFSFLCHYELVVPLGENDIRREVYEDGEVIETISELVTPMNAGPVRRMSGAIPCIDEDGKLYFDAPYRDGAHAQWDSKALGGIPIKVMTLDGKLIEKD